MKRKALIISVPEAKGQGYLPGAEVDGEHWESFLSSDNAGAWEPEEIDLLVNPSLDEVRTRIQRMAEFEYTFVACSGHGRHLWEKTFGYDTLVLGDGQEIKEHELIPASGRATLLMDSCREMEMLLKADRGGRQKLAAFVEHNLVYRVQCRRMFNAHLEQCSKGTIKLKACSLDETAGEDDQGRFGGHFTNALIAPIETNGTTIAGRMGKAVIDLNDAFTIASLGVQARDPNQHPVFEPGRRTTFYPFSVYP